MIKEGINTMLNNRETIMKKALFVILVLSLMLCLACDTAPEKEKAAFGSSTFGGSVMGE